MIEGCSKGIGHAGNRAVGVRFVEVFHSGMKRAVCERIFGGNGSGLAAFSHKH